MGWLLVVFGAGLLDLGRFEVLFGAWFDESLESLGLGEFLQPEWCEA